MAILLNAKHVKKSTRVHNISGRVIAVDFMVNGRSYCGIATYIPHCGYSAAHLEQTYDQLRCITSKAYRSNKRIVIGGDFNTQHGVGVRGLMLDEFAREFRLDITNASSPQLIDDWTFESSMGVRRLLKIFQFTHPVHLTF